MIPSLLLCGRVAVESSLHILRRVLCNSGSFAKERFRYLVHARFDFFLRHGVAVAEQQSLAQLALQGVFDTNERIADEIAGGRSPWGFPPEITGNIRWRKSVRMPMIYPCWENGGRAW